MMFACILVLIIIPFLPAALLPCTLCIFFSSRELNEMGIQVDDSENSDSEPSVDVPSICLSVCF
jgi:hypothetical protein